MGSGQAEILVVLGVVVVIALAAFYAFQTGLISPSPVPASIAVQQRAVKDSVNNLIREATLRSLKTVSTQGGYASPPPGSVTFLDKQVPYWFSSGTTQKPDVRANLQSALSISLAEGVGVLDTSLETVSFGQPVVTMKILPRRIDLSVSLPTTIGDYTTTDPYTVSVPTRFGEILEFASAFVDAYPQYRFLEYFTAASIFISPIKDDIQSVPAFLQPPCGEIAVKSSLDVLPEMEELIRRTLANTYLTGQAPNSCERWTQVGDSWGCDGRFTPANIGSAPKYEIPALNHKTYSDLDVTFHLPDRFRLDLSSFQMSPDPAIASFQIIPFFGGCVPDPVTIRYFLLYPSIVRVKDPDTSNLFQFAVQVYLKDTKPGSLTAVAGYLPPAQTELCNNALCSMNLKVTADGTPAADAQVVYLGCPVGTTNEAGVIEASVPCGAGALSVRKAGYAPLSPAFNSQQVRNLTLNLQKVPRFTLHLHEVDVITQPSTYTIPTNSLSYLNNKKAFLIFTSVNTSQVYSFLASSSALTISTLPPDRYALSATLTSPDGQSVYGSAALDITLPESADGKTFHLYLPKDISFSTGDEASQVRTSLLYGDLLTQCGLVFSETPATEGCLRPASEITGGLI